MKMKLFDDNVNNNDELENIKINTEFAKRYEHNNKRQDLEKYEVMKKKGIIDSDSESESDSDMDDVDAGADIKQVLDGILKIRNKDPSLLLPDTKLFESDDEKSEDEKIKSKSKPKPKYYLKDVIAQNLIEKGSDYDSEENSEEEEEDRKVKTFVEEQEDLRNEVLEAIAAEEDGKDADGDAFWNVKEKVAGDEEEEADDELKEKVDEVFPEDEFLRKYILEKMWIDKEKNNIGDDNDGIDLSEDEEEVLKQEDYERDYNFRFEESKSDRVEGHSRHVDSSVRTVNNTRKEARRRKKEREMQAEMERAEEVKRLKNLKRKETEEKIKKIMEIAGVEDGDKIPLNEDYLDKDFDPVEFDKTMGTAFGDEYYNANDVDSGFVGVGDDDGEEKPDFEKEDELLGLPKNWDVIKSKDGFLAKRGKDKRVLSDVEEENEEEEEEEEEVVEAVEGKRKKKRKSKLAEALKKDLEEELYKYDYEDAIGDLKTRFKYQHVKPDRYRLTAAEILWLDEQELNQYVSLKKLATYREQDWRVPQHRKRMLVDGFLNPQSKQKKVKKSDGEGSSKVAEEPQSNEEGHKLSRSARRRQNRKERKLPQSRLVAYGEIPSKSNKSKN